MNKRVLSGLCALILGLALLLPFAVPAFATGSSDDPIADAVSEYMSTPVVVGDYADLLTPAEETVLRGTYASLKELYNVNVAVATVQTLNGRTVENAVESYVANESNLDGSTVILYISMEDRDFDIFATIGRAENIFFDKGREYIFRQVKPLLSSGDYYEAFKRFGECCQDFLARDAAGDPYTARDLPNEKSPVCFLIAIGAGLLIGTIIMNKYKSELKTVRRRNEATSYVRQGSMQITMANEMFLYSNVSKVRRQTESSSGGSHSSHTSGGGHTSGKF
ncbi:MAG: TPM domain-containing protein [Clostridia bacterium]|nr:TPM domain-containing protein [Clostridia bacterium]